MSLFNCSPTRSFSFSPASDLSAPPAIDWGILLGSGGLFGCLFLLFLRYVPFIPIAEVKKLQEDVALSEGARP